MIGSIIEAGPFLQHQRAGKRAGRCSTWQTHHPGSLCGSHVVMERSTQRMVGGSGSGFCSSLFSTGARAGGTSRGNLAA